ncbi:hypothetical protein GVN18_40990 [Pseudomonas sp. ODNR1LW]|nr:hypothetical protein [Pseudomonas sp. ODNR1LW]
MERPTVEDAGLGGLNDDHRLIWRRRLRKEPPFSIEVQLDAEADASNVGWGISLKKSPD